MRKVMILISLLVLMLLGTASIASAFETRESSAGLASVGKNETVDDDLLLTGKSAIIDGIVNGDVLAVGDTVTINGTINGNLLAFATHVELNGVVNGAVITAGNSVTVSGSVQRSLVAAGSRVALSETAKIGGSLIAGADRLAHRGVIARGVAAAGSNLLIDGTVGREIKAGGGDLVFTANAHVGGTVDLWSDHQAVVATGAKTGAITHHAYNSDWSSFTKPWYLQPGWIILKLGGFLALGLVLLALFPRLRSRFPETMASNLWQAPLAGFLALVATPIAAVILMITVIGLPIGLITLVAYPVLIYVSQVLVAWAVGRFLADRVPGLETQAWPVLFLAGAVLTTLLVEVPYLGGIMTAAMLFYGLGTIWLLITNRGRAA